MRRQRGFNLVETAIAVAVLGIVLLTVMLGQQGSGGPVSPPGESGMMDLILAETIKFAKKNNRLPCPDVAGTGVEDCTASVGGVPFTTIGVSLPGTAADAVIAKKFIYGVYRGAAAASDLAVAAERSVPADAASAGASYMNLDDFRQGIINAWAEVPAAPGADTNRIYVTGNDAGSGASNCTTNKVTNVALVIAYSGKNGVFEGAQPGLSWPTGGGVKCFVGPNKPVSADYDDQVRAVSFPELLGALSR